MSVGSSRASKPKAGLSKKRRLLDPDEPDASDSGSPGMLSETSSLKSASKGSKMIDVLSEANRPKVLPKHLPGLKSSDDQVHLPAVLSLSNGTTITLTYGRTTAQASEKDEDFWEQVKQRVHQPQQVCSDEVDGTMLSSMKSLEFHSAIFPTMLTRMPALSYNKLPTSAKHIGKNTFKTYLNFIITNANRRLENIKNPSIAPGIKTQDQRPRNHKQTSLNDSRDSHRSRRAQQDRSPHCRQHK